MLCAKRYFKTSKIKPSGFLGRDTKKAPRRVLFNQWCGLLCSYRTKDYEDFKRFCRKNGQYYAIIGLSGG